MTTSHAALNGLQRCLTFTEEQRDSDSSFYSSGIEALKQIRDIATQIMLASNEALAKVGLDESLEIVKSTSSQLTNPEFILEEAAKVSEQTASQVVNQIFSVVFNQFNGNSQQNVLIEQVDTFQSSASANIEVKPEVDPEILDVEVEDSKKSSRSHSEIYDYKKILAEVANLPISKFSSPQIKTGAILVSEYFDVRFNKRYDVHQIHWFSMEKLRDYLVSVLLGFSESVVKGQYQEFCSDFKLWLSEIRENSSKYTLPANCASIFFEILNKDPNSVSKQLSNEALSYFDDMWSELWKLGYYKFKKWSNLTCYPSKDVDWIRKQLNSSLKCESNKRSWNLDGEIDKILTLWQDLEEYESFDVCRAIVIKDSILLQSLEYQDLVKLPRELLRESLKMYITSNGYASVSKLKMKLDSMRSIMKYTDEKFDSLEDSYKYLSEFSPNDLDLVEVLEHYVVEELGVSRANL